MVEVALRAVSLLALSSPMGIEAQTAMALARALLIALVAIAVSGLLSSWLAAQRGRSRTTAWILLLAPFFTPPLLVSYSLARLSMALIVSPCGHEALYLGGLALKLIPIAVALRTLLPPPPSAEARYAFYMFAPPGLWQRAAFRLRAMGHPPWIIGGLVFLLAFGDFELASLWSVKTWTMAVFDAQTGGYTLGATLRLALWPLAVQLAILVAVAISRRDLSVVDGETEPRAVWLPWSYLATSATLVCAIPLVIVASQAIAGIPSLLQNFVLGGQLLTSVALSLAAAAVATVIAAYAERSSMLSLLCITPGLLGALTISLLLLTLFQAPGLHAFYDTPLPLGIALIVLLLPLALLLAALWRQPDAALHIARQIGSRRLIWDLETRPRVIAAGLLFCWAYFDFTASSILAPTGFTPVFVRLHNLAHYGQTAVLSAMMLVAFATPILVLLLTGATWRIYARGHGR